MRTTPALIWSLACTGLATTVPPRKKSWPALLVRDQPTSPRESATATVVEVVVFARAARAPKERASSRVAEPVPISAALALRSVSDQTNSAASFWANRVPPRLGLSPVDR